jgi:flagellar biosynthesis protein
MIMDKRKRAAALKYKPDEDAAPRVVAKGSGSIAERILEVAREHKIPLKEDPQLVEVLSTIELNREIPPELYKAVAEILVFVYRMTKKDTKALL